MHSIEKRPLNDLSRLDSSGRHRSGYWILHHGRAHLLHL